MKEILDLYADQKNKNDLLVKEITINNQDFQRLFDTIKGKVEVVNGGRVVDLAIAYIQKLESPPKLPEQLSDEGRKEVMTDGNSQ